jgi:hypothetical protein
MTGRVRLEALQWFGLFGGALAWAVQHVAGYGIADAGCNVAGRQWGLDVQTMQIVLSVAAGAAVLAAEAAALVVFRATRDAPENAPGPVGRLRFFAEAALLGNVLFLVIVVFDGVSTVYQLPCRPS